LIGTGLTLGVLTYVKKLNSPSIYFIHCDLINKTKNLLNGKKWDVLAKFKMKGLPYEKVSYHPPPQEVCMTAPQTPLNIASPSVSEMKMANPFISRACLWNLN